ncbi:MAG: VPLPA-CTERM sorting domain-containing protein [Candidatus Thiodiazotropha sp.]
MKKLLGLVLACSLYFFGSAQSAPVYYTFEGHITNIRDDVGAVASAGLSVNDNVAYTFLIDTDRLGTLTRNDGSVSVLPDTTPDYDYFYVDFISGSEINPVDGGSFNEPFSTAERNYGADMFSTASGMITGGSQNNYVMFYSHDQYVNDWVIGSNLYGFEMAMGSNFQSSSYNVDLSLTSMNPVPIPAAAWLFISGLLGLLGFNYRKNKE